MESQTKSLENLPLSRFHWRLIAMAGGSAFVDGYILGIIAIALSLLTSEFGLGPVWVGLIGASSMIGMFVGSLVCGRLTDVIGRKVMFTITIIVFIVGSILQFFVADALQLLILRLVLGIAIGADYPIAAAYLAELAPKKHRGSMLSSMTLFWWSGYVVSFVVGYAMSGLPWRWILVTSAVPAIIILLLRLGFPESPRWLMSKGRGADATSIIQHHLGPNVYLEESVATAENPKMRVKDLFKGGYLKLILFTSVFWMCQVAPSYAIHTLQPQLFKALDVDNPLLATMVVTALSLLGVVPALFMVKRLGRRRLLIVTMSFMFVPLLVVGTFPTAMAGILILAFVIFTVFESAGSVLQFVYPGELFPTEVRGTATGIATSVSRIGSSISTFVLPVIYTNFGVSIAMLLTAAMVGVGLLVSIKWAPETRHLTLAEASSIGRL